MKYYGAIGYGATYEEVPGVQKLQIVEKHYYGDVNRNTKRWQSASDQLNDNFVVSNQISIVADDYAYSHLGEIVYAVWNDTKWKVQSATIDRPRIVLELGGVYNGDKT